LRAQQSNGELLIDQVPHTAVSVIDPRVAYLNSNILDDDEARVPAMGRSNPLALPFPAAAKTGTTNDFRDNWTMGYTPGLVVGVWTGNTDNSEMINISGLTGAAPLWSDYMQAVYTNYDLLETLKVNGAEPAADFVRPEGLEERPLCSLSSVTIGAVECAPAGSELFLVNNNPAAPATIDPNLVAWEEIEPAVLRMPAVPLPPVPAEVLLGAELDEDAPPPQLFCHLAEGTDATLLPPDALPQIFLAPPRNPESVKAAHEWAQANNVALLPTAVCNEELLALARDPNRVAVYRISSPAQGEKVSGILPIMGTADFEPGVVQFYKIELGIPNGDNVDWVTLGETHSQPVVNGPLEMLHAEALPPGDYFLRLIVVKDSNYVGEPHTITITIES
jgi:hypothetical protein